MIRTIAIITAFLTFFTIPCLTQEDVKSRELRDRVLRDRQALVEIPLQRSTGIERLSRNISITSLREKTAYALISPLTVDWFLSSGYQFEITGTSGTKSVRTSASMHHAMEWETYPSYTQYDSIMRFLADSWPGLCRLDTIGTSTLGKLVMVLKISANCGLDETEPEVFYTSTIHGNEPAGFVLLLRLAEKLLSGYGVDPEMTELLDNLEIWINPLANPDGTYNNGDEITSPVRNNANNYDLNRNFPDPEGPVTSRQKETSDMIKFMASRNFVLSANFHSGEEVVNYPWDRWSRDHPDKVWFNQISRAYADTVHRHAPEGYMTFLDNGVTPGYDWYPLFGGRQDYVTWELQGREVTIELDDDFVTPENELNSLWEYNYRSLVGYLGNAMHGISGVVTDSETGMPVAARIFIRGRDADSSHVYSDTLTGEFTRLLEPGGWDLEFSAPGYRTIVKEGVLLANGEGVMLNVEMDPLLTPVDTTTPAEPLFYPNPGTGMVKAVLPDELHGDVNVRIFSQTGTLLSDQQFSVKPGEPVMLNTTQFARGIYFVIFTGKSNRLVFRSKLVVAGVF